VTTAEVSAPVAVGRDPDVFLDTNCESAAKYDRLDSRISERESRSQERDGSAGWHSR